MPIVCHQGYRIAVEHPAVWADRGERIVRDLVEVMTNRQITDECLQHLIDSRERLIAGHYELPDDRGCLMFVLTEPLGEDQIRTRQDLTRFLAANKAFRVGQGMLQRRIRPNISRRSGWCD